jgi:hypothetical protein
MGGVCENFSGTFVPQSIGRAPPPPRGRLNLPPISGADPGTEVRGGATHFEAGSLGAALRHPVGSGRSPDWGPGGTP